MMLVKFKNSPNYIRPYWFLKFELNPNPRFYSTSLMSSHPFNTSSAWGSNQLLHDTYRVSLWSSLLGTNRSSNPTIIASFAEAATSNPSIIATCLSSSSKEQFKSGHLRLCQAFVPGYLEQGYTRLPLILSPWTYVWTMPRRLGFSQDSVLDQRHQLASTFHNRKRNSRQQGNLSLSCAPCYLHPR
ncbi:hypothetical protein BGW80DRAFT_1265254 [Lactifluus volemus]|nr:hypothetical protein BGW80DRAFT_1265254 [Lactifluus volemus]